MTFTEILDEAVELLRREKRVSYRALKRQYDLDDAACDDLRYELTEIRKIAVDQNNQLLVWAGDVRNREPETPPHLNTVHTAQPERRHLTVFFVDLVGSTPIAEGMDPEEFREIILGYREVCTRAIERQEGYVHLFVGDGVLAYFGYPVAHDEDALRAVRAGLEIVSELPARATERNQPLAARVGIHSGLVVAGDITAGEFSEQRAIIGDTPNRAARIQGFAKPDQVVISAETYRLVEGNFDCEDLGEVPLKGISEPVHLYEILGERAAVSRFDVVMRRGLTPFVGRIVEQSRLRELWEDAKKNKGNVAIVCGEPGIGKSRLISEFNESALKDRANVVLLQCSPYHQSSALHPIITHFEIILDAEREKSPQSRVKTLERELASRGLLEEDNLPLLAAALSLPQPTSAPALEMNPLKQKERTQNALVAWFLAEARHQPALVICEDLQWADPSTLGILGALLAQVPTTQMMCLLTHRPEFDSPWGNLTNATTLELRRLEATDVKQLVEKTAAGSSMPAEVIHQILTRTDGVPLFVEELTKMVIESDLVQLVNNHYELTGQLTSLAIPATLHESLMARLDRLPSAKAVAQIGSAIGREFSLNLIKAVSGMDEETLRDKLAELESSGFLFQRDQAPREEYVFKHALIQNAAYESLLKSQSQELHLKIARILEARFPETVDAQPERLAQHYTGADLASEAVPYWIEASARAQQRAANLEAITHAYQGLDSLVAMNESKERDMQELALRGTLGLSLMFTKGYAAPEIEETYRQILSLCHRLGDPADPLLAMWGLYAHYFTAGDLRQSADLAHEMLSIAKRREAPIHEVSALTCCGYADAWRGDIGMARKHLESGLELYNTEQHLALVATYGEDQGIFCAALLPWVLWLLGYPDQARERSAEALNYAETIQHPLHQSVAWFYVAMLRQSLREHDKAIEIGVKNVEFCNDQVLPYFGALTCLPLGYSYAASGDMESASTSLRTGFDLREMIGALLVQSYALANRAEVAAMAGDAEHGLKDLENALKWATESDENVWVAEIYRLTGELILQVRPEAEVEAEMHFEQSLNTARTQGAKSLELRAAISQARLWRHQGKTEQAHALLTDVYGWFSEGFNTADLIEAKTLIYGLEEQSTIASPL